jgi:hypothetical protein
VPDHFLPFGAVTDLYEAAGMDSDSVVGRVLARVAG